MTPNIDIEYRGLRPGGKWEWGMRKYRAEDRGVEQSAESMGRRAEGK